MADDPRDPREQDKRRQLQLRQLNDPVFRIAREARAAAGGLVRRAAEPFLYEGAGRRAPREVQKAIERFRALPLATRAQVRSLWAFVLGSGTPPYKAMKSEVQYGPPPPATMGMQTCGNCVSAYQHVTTGVLICDCVRGTIAPQAWCSKWAPPIAPAAYAAYQEGGQ